MENVTLYQYRKYFDKENVQQTFDYISRFGNFPAKSHVLGPENCISKVPLERKIFFNHVAFNQGIATVL